MKYESKRQFDSKLKNLLGRRSTSSFISTVVCLLLISCSNLVKDPKIKLERVDVTDANVQGANLNFILEVENPNNYEIKVDEVQYKVFLGDQFFASAKTPKPVTVAASSKTQVSLPLPIQFSQLLGGIGNLLTGKSLNYKVQGQAKLSFLGLNIPFDENGMFRLGLDGIKEEKIKKD